jgi:3-phosphoshikimate 1-carboxyvinyltransferase
MIVEPLTRPPDAVVEVPGSKSITNRALVCAALADGDSTLHGALVADDTQAMTTCLHALGIDVDWSGTDARVNGCAGRLPRDEAHLDARLSGTTARFLLPVLALGRGPYVLDGGAPLQRRPMGPLAAAVRALGATVDGDALPLTVRGPATGGPVEIPGDVTSQFVSALLLVRPCLRGGLELRMTSPLVARPYVALTEAVMAGFDAADGYRGREYDIEPDASAASYFFAVSAIAGGRVRVGIDRSSPQADAQFVRVLEEMGAVVRDDTEVVGTGTLRGGTFDLRDMPDMAPTLAVVGVFAESPVTVTGVAFIRGHESDRIAAVVTELRRCGIEAEEHDDGFTVVPGTPVRTRVETYDDHRMAMSFAVLGACGAGVEIADAGCVAKTFPRFFEVLDALR